MAQVCFVRRIPTGTYVGTRKTLRAKPEHPQTSRFPKSSQLKPHKYSRMQYLSFNNNNNRDVVVEVFLPEEMDYNSSLEQKEDLVVGDDD
jgi:hypothetical protein